MSCLNECLYVSFEFQMCTHVLVLSTNVLYVCFFHWFVCILRYALDRKLGILYINFVNM